MAEPFLAEVRMMSFNFPPKGWALCNGQFLPINQNQALFSLLGTTFGGDGRTTFALPDLRGRTPVHVGNGITLGQRAGEEAHTLSMNEMPQHTHVASASGDGGDQAIPTGNVLASWNNLWLNATALTPLRAGTVANAGGNQPHLNMQPFLTLNFCIALQGIFPSPN